LCVLTSIWFIFSVSNIRENALSLKKGREQEVPIHCFFCISKPMTSSSVENKMYVLEKVSWFSQKQPWPETPEFMDDFCFVEIVSLRIYSDTENV
jgi:hypothetical protein